MFISARSEVAMDLKRFNLSVVSINGPNLRFLALGIFFVLLVLEHTWNSMEIKSGVQYALSSLQQENKDYEIDSLFVALLTNGDASIDYNLVINSNKSSTNVTLFGETVQNLTLTDYNETNIRYLPTGLPNQITVISQTSPDIHVTYTTPDLVDKQNRNWTFSFSFADKFLLKMPSQAHIIDMEPPAFLTPTDEQNLWGFGPGNVQVSYIIGPLGTREEAQASIRSVEEAIKDTRSHYDGIVLGNATVLLENARSNLKQGKYLETVTYATNIMTLLQNTGQNFMLGKDAISQAESDIQNKRNNGYDTSQAEGTLSTARSLFQAGEYKKAEDVAKQAISQAEPKSGTLSGFNRNITIIFIIVGVIVAITIVIFFIIQKSKSSLARRTDAMENPKENKDSNVLYDTNTSTTKVQNVSPIHFNISDDSPHEGVEIKDYLDKVVEEVGNVRKNQEQQDTVTLSPSREHSIDKESLVGVVAQMKEEKPYFRNEDKDLLDFLCEKGGSAFESEIRNKFVLPRTSLWRLIKRLEREELVEVRKIGGQNLIKLRFEDKSN